ALSTGFSAHMHWENPAGGAAVDCDTVCRYVCLDPAGDIVFYNQKNKRDSTMVVYAPLHCAWKMESADSILIRYRLQFQDMDLPLEICALKDEIHE
ncbi:MAG: hypothetical protein LIO46_06970, partial [Clostridiales bacterium]|nr:hypothetical protein [Clostridiales bacterium]